MSNIPNLLMIRQMLLEIENSNLLQIVSGKKMPAQNALAFDFFAKKYIHIIYESDTSSMDIFKKKCKGKMFGRQKIL